MADHPSASDWFWGGGILAVGTGARWLWERLSRSHQKRVADLDAREDELDAKEAELVKKMEARLSVLENTVEEQGKALEAHRIALHVLVAKVARDDPHAPELRQVADLLGSAFPIHFHTPPDIADLANRIP